MILTNVSSFMRSNRLVVNDVSPQLVSSHVDSPSPTKQPVQG